MVFFLLQYLRDDLISIRKKSTVNGSVSTYFCKQGRSINSADKHACDVRVLKFTTHRIQTFFDTLLNQKVYKKQWLHTDIFWVFSSISTKERNHPRVFTSLKQSCFHIFRLMMLHCIFMYVSLMSWQDRQILLNSRVGGPTTWNCLHPSPLSGCAKYQKKFIFLDNSCENAIKIKLYITIFNEIKNCGLMLQDITAFLLEISE